MSKAIYNSKLKLSDLLPARLALRLGKLIRELNTVQAASSTVEVDEKHIDLSRLNYEYYKKASVEMRTIGILSPSLRLKGGVSNHVRRLIGYLSSSPEYVVEEYVPGHARLEADKKIVVRLRDFRSLVKRLRCHDLLVYNPLSES